jgi:alpha-N-acetylglucosamine transferase
MAREYDGADRECQRTKMWFNNTVKTSETKAKANRRLVLVKFLKGESKGGYDVIKQLAYRESLHDAIKSVDYDEYISSGRDAKSFLPSKSKSTK